MHHQSQNRIQQSLINIILEKLGEDHPSTHSPSSFRPPPGHPRAIYASARPSSCTKPRTSRWLSAPSHSLEARGVTGGHGGHGVTIIFCWGKNTCNCGYLRQSTPKAYVHSSYICSIHYSE